MSFIMIRDLSARKQFILAILFSSLVGVGLFSYSAHLSHSLNYDYLLWNLFLAWTPVLFSTRLVSVLGRKPWSSWEALGLSLLWIVFLPNSFYMISDFIHLRDAQAGQVLFYAVTFTSIIYSAVLLGFLSLYMVHVELKKRFSGREAAMWVAFTLLICSLAIYIGRDLRWNSWDILTNPGGLIFDVSNRLLHVSAYTQILSTAGVFFVLLGSMYLLAWSGIKLLRQR
jgi:uncharacterized membrane protein